MTCRTLGLLVTLTLSILVAPLAAEVQQTRNVYRIGWLSPGVPGPDHDPPVDAFRQGCASSAMSKASTSSLRTVGRRGGSSGSPTWRSSWSSSRWR
jgi:hypothetical protein